MKTVRKSGVLMPVASLPGKYGIGTFGKESYRFVDMLSMAGQSYWQILPLGPTSYGDSPYQSFSTFAGNPYFIDLEMLVEEGKKKKKEADSYDFGKTLKNIKENNKNLRNLKKNKLINLPDTNMSNNLRYLGTQKKKFLYAREYVNLYKKLGYSHIYIYDNNDINEEKFEDVIQDEIDWGFVTIINIRGKIKGQCYAYNDCYEKYNKLYDWLSFFDFDEFLSLKEKNIQKFLTSKR